jgi:hypothetical protein
MNNGQFIQGESRLLFISRENAKTQKNSLQANKAFAYNEL